MTFYSVLVFAHIASAFFLFAGLLLEAVVIGFLRRNPDLAPFRAWTRVFSLAPILYGPALGVILLSGGYLGAQMSSWGQGWIRISFFTLFVIGAIGAIFTSRRIKSIRRLIAEASDSATLQNKLQDPVLLASVRIRIALVFGVLLLMVSKLAFGPSIAVVAVAFAFGVAAALPAWKKSAQTRTAI
ncbi:MAG TPA: DUF2269 family protein [Candidatus Sulfotelmatobacter sp.]|nr:DUF2269 family protein [Candidatus Sulfotelmatobacter sp.]